MRMSHLASITFACSISIFATASFAQQSSNDGRCDVLSDATPSLYGLCIAYWATLSNGNSEASSKILDKYAEKQTESDPDMPGLLTDQCPCWTLVELDTWKNNVVDPGSISCETNGQTLSWKASNGGDLLQTDSSFNTCYAAISSTTSGTGTGFTRFDQSLSQDIYDSCSNGLASICP